MQFFKQKDGSDNRSNDDAVNKKEVPVTDKSGGFTKEKAIELWEKIKKQFLENSLPGLTIATVSLPLSIALSVASGVGPTAGIITSIWASFFAAIFASSKYNIIGAASGLIAIIAPFVTSFDGVESIYLITYLSIASGLLIFAIYILRLDKFLSYIPSSVMYGFSVGIALVVMFGQIPAILGIPKDIMTHGHDHNFEKILEPFKHLIHSNWLSIILFISFLGLTLIITKYLKKIPAVVLVAPLGIVVGYVLSLAQVKDSIKLPVLYTLGSEFKNFSFNPFQINLIPKDLSTFSIFTQPLFWQSALTIAIIASLETLITAKIADKQTKSRCNTSIELRGLSIANIASGIFGGIPAAGVFLRTGLNIKSGATSRLAQGLAGLFTLILGLIFIDYFKYMPMAIIAAILCKVAAGLIDLKEGQKYWKFDKPSLFVGMAVAVLTVALDASLGILLGVVAALLIFVDKLSKGEFEATFNFQRAVIQCEHGNCFAFPSRKVDLVVYSIEGVMAYIDAPNHKENFLKIARHKNIQNVVIRLRDLFYLDLDGLELLEEAIITMQSKGKRVILTKPSPQIVEIMQKNSFIKNMFDNGLVFDKTSEALYSIGFQKEDLGRKTPNYSH